METFNIEDVRKLREEVEALRRDYARLDGRLDVIEDLLQPADATERVIITPKEVNRD